MKKLSFLALLIFSIPAFAFSSLHTPKTPHYEGVRRVAIISLFDGSFYDYKTKLFSFKKPRTKYPFYYTEHFNQETEALLNHNLKGQFEIVDLGLRERIPQGTAFPGVQNFLTYYQHTLRDLIQSKQIDALFIVYPYLKTEDNGAQASGGLLGALLVEAIGPKYMTGPVLKNNSSVILEGMIGFFDVRGMKNGQMNALPKEVSKKPLTINAWLPKNSIRSQIPTAEDQRVAYGTILKELPKQVTKTLSSMRTMQRHVPRR